MENEIWRPIPNYPECYFVSNIGRVKRIYTTKKWHGIEPITKEFIYTNILSNSHKYPSVGIRQKGKKHSQQLVHRLVATAFLENPNNLPQVNHKNGIRQDNRVENLEWCTGKENTIHAKEVLKRDFGIKRRRSILCLNNGIIYSYYMEAARLLGHSAE